MDKTKIGIIGCGNISRAYLDMGQRFPLTEVAAVADMIPERAQAAAAEYGIPRACSVDELLADPEISIVLNLTIPGAHAEVALQTLDAGKHTYGEKPLAVNRAQGQQIMERAAQTKLRVGSAPDTFLGGGVQTARKLIDDGAIGTPIAASAHMACHGHESWHPDPAFYYKIGGGPLLDMGPYYLTALVNLLGPVKRAVASASVTFPERTITSEPKFGEQVTVDVPTHVTGIMQFESGAVGTLLTTFDVWHTNLPLLEIYGTEGSLSVGDPNGFGGPIRLRKAGDPEWADVPLTHIYSEGNRGIGVADMAYALASGRPHRASGALAFHVLDIMDTLLESSLEGKYLDLQSRCDRPAMLPVGLTPGTLDE
ncbi:MAG: Gfo/Idh/MocA family oxidoreductase [Armatimonadota bacterium]